jgi:hypothetical protein
VKQRFLFPLPPSERGAPIGQAPLVPFVCACHNQRVEITAYGETCLRFKGREGVVVADAFPPIVGPTGRGLTADIVTYSRDDSVPTLGLDKSAKAAGKGARRGRLDGRRVPTSLESAFVLDSPGEYEVHGVLINGVRTFRDDEKGAQRGANLCFVYELDGLQAIHLGDVGHLLDEETLGEVGTVAVACVPIGGALSGARAAELVAQLDAKLVVPMPLDADGKGPDELQRFLHEMSVQHSEPVAKLSVTISSLPQETTVVMLETRGRG